jgi:hypothetical protein
VRFDLPIGLIVLGPDFRAMHQINAYLLHPGKFLWWHVLLWHRVAGRLMCR